jgi:hypothetical protein
MTTTTLAVNWWLFGGIPAGVILLFLAFFVIQYGSLWIQAFVSGARVGIFDLIMMRFRKVDPRSIVINRIAAKKAGIDLPTDWLEAHYLAGGRVTNVVRAMIAADKARIDLGWERATAIDLAGRDIDRLPAPDDDEEHDRRGREGRHPAQGEGASHRAHQHLAAHRRCDRGDDHRARRRGHRLGDRLVRLAQGRAGESGQHLQGGAQEGPRLGDVVRDPLDRHRGRGRGREIAQEAEYQAEARKNRALVILAEAEVPKAMADAFRSGNLGIMDYYRMKNIMADTSMRDSISGGHEDEQPQEGT